ncbi:hypothetical protein ELH26_02370 [Rhizobium leguminosarum]|uniref:hypothetical protein n=1 Tax=Rhizobium leguminosarum TaxID=384 RepID=UPI001031A8AB|nr:hypothetical protein [Rhizobium leguminosarum]TBC92955.1 hypothetical protein ELH26_02370 [Rhizobium leguminosarum]
MSSNLTWSASMPRRLIATSLSRANAPLRFDNGQATAAAVGAEFVAIKAIWGYECGSLEWLSEFRHRRQSLQGPRLRQTSSRRAKAGQV